MADAQGITFTLDLEHHWYSADRDRFVAPAEALLAMCERRGVRGTIFVLGEVAESHPDLVRRFAAAGHEIGLHGYRHTPLPDLSLDAIRDDIRTGKALLEAVTGTACVGYRAPFFSLTPPARGAVGVLAELGFRYSSSVLPVANPQFGWPGAPATPFAWPEGILELPVPVFTVAGRGVPFLGGTYLRVLPRAFVTLGQRRAHGQLLWTYCHPYDLDPGDPFQVLPSLGRAQSRLLWYRRGAMLDRVERLIAANSAPPLRERVAAGISHLAAAPQ